MFKRNTLGQMNPKKPSFFPKLNNSNHKYKTIDDIDSYENRINNSINNTNFQELLSEYKKNNSNSNTERNEVIKELENEENI